MRSATTSRATRRFSSGRSHFRLHAARGVAVALSLLASLLQADASAGPPSVAMKTSIKEVDATVPVGVNAPHRAFVSRRTLTSTESGATMDFEIALKMRNLPELQDRVRHGAHVSPGELDAKYNPSQADYDKVVAWLTSQGFAITRQDKNHLAVFARAKVSELQSALGVSFARVSFEGAEYTSAVTAPNLPNDIATLVVGVNGLQPHLRMHKHAILRPNSLTGTNPPFLPRQIAQAYDATPLYNSSVTGTGQSIAIVIDTFPSQSDLTSFWSTYGVSQSLSNISFIQVVSGTLPAPEGEETLDTEWSSSIAPGAKVRVYASQSLDFTNLDEAYQQVYSDAVAHPEYGIHQMSMSYGIGETYTSDSQVETDDQYFLELAAAGVTVFASSGDSGSTPGDLGAGDERGPLQVSSPASDPNVTGVGGTSLHLNTSGSISSESVWNNSYGASGGGVSIYFTRPYWQNGNGVTSGTARLVPDVAAAADPATGAVVVLGGSQDVYGGTSWSCPTWAGFCALMNQERANAGKGSLGLLGPYLYPQLGTSKFHDITSGNNATNSSQGSYSASTGYDMASGIGTPDVNALAQAFVSFVPGTPVAPVITSGAPTSSVTINSNYTFNFTATGNPTPTFALTGGSLPTGLTLASNGLLSGKPTVGGTFYATVTASNNVAPAASVTFTITVQDLPAAPAFTSSAPSSTALIGTAYSFTLTASGYPAPTFSLASGSLPPGLALSSGGLLDGTPTQAGTFTGTISAANGVGSAATQNFSITVAQPAPPTITNGPTTAVALVNQAYSFTYTATGVPTPVFAVATGALPPGLTLSSAGVLSGTPIQAGLFSGTIAAENGQTPPAAQAFSIAVHEAPVFTNTPISAPIALSVPYAFTLTTNGYPAPTFSVTAGSLPPGLTLSSAGVISGAATHTGTYTGTFTATSSAGTATQNFSFTVASTLSLTVSLPATVNEGDPDGTGTVQLNATSSSVTTVTLTSSNTGAMTVPINVIIPAGQLSGTFAYTIIDNLSVYGTQTTTINAAASGWTTAGAVVTVTDNKTTDNWSTYGNGPAHTGVYPGPLLRGTYTQAWSAAVPFASGDDTGLNQVAVAKGVVYVTPVTRFGVAALTALNAATGATDWQYTYTSSSGGNEYNSISPPTYYKGRVYVQQDTGLTNGGSPIISAALDSFDSGTGQLEWSSNYGSQWENYLAPMAYQAAGVWCCGGEYGGASGFTFNGTAKTPVSLESSYSWTPAYYNGLVYCWDGDTFTAITPSSAAVSWSVSATSSDNYAMNCSAAIANGIAYVDGNTALTAINLTTHAQVWSDAGPFVGTPAIQNGLVYAISGSQIKVLNATTGAVVRTLQSLDSAIAGQPIVASDCVIVSSSTTTTIISLLTGTVAQAIPIGGPVSVAGDTLYIASPAGTVYAYRPSSTGSTFDSAGASGLTSYGYTASGTYTATLGFVPTTGTVLTLINNTGPNAISGTFSNLPDGCTISLTYNDTAYYFRVSYSGGDGNDLTLTYVSAPPQAPVLANSPLATGAAVNSPFAFAYSAGGYPAPTFSVTSGALPAGLTLSSAGVISGSPSQIGTYSGTVTATNTSGSSSQNFTLTVVSSPGLTVALPSSVDMDDPDGVGVVTTNATAATDLTVQLASSNTGALTVPASVVIPAGQNSAQFTYSVIDNAAAPGTQSVTVTASATSWVSGSQVVTVTGGATTTNWSTFGNGPARTGYYPGPLLNGAYHQAWSASFTGGSAALNQVAINDGLVYVSAAGGFNGLSQLTAVRATTGAQVWQYTFPTSDTVCAPTVYKGNVYLQCDNNSINDLWSLDSATGAVNWNAPYNAQWETYLSPLVQQSVGIWTGGGEYGGYYHFNFDGTQAYFGSEPQTDGWTPTLYDGVIYTWVAGQFDAIDPSTGAVSWSLQPGYSGILDSYTMDSGLPIDNNVAFLVINQSLEPNGSQQLTAVNLTTHAVLWNQTGTFFGTPAVHNGVVYVISGSQVKALNALTGATLATMETNDTGLANQPVIATDSLVVASSTATYLFNLQTGTLAQTIPNGGQVSVAGGTLYIAGTDSTVRAFQSASAPFTLAADGSGALVAYGYVASGQAFTGTLTYAPAAGAVITVINNRGTDPITGSFSNLPDGGTINLTYNGVTYPFKANYEGGDGNDLTLTYAPVGGGIAKITSVPQPSTVAIGAPYSFTYTATGYPAPTFTVSSGSLPPGLTLSSSGVVSGTPSQGGVYNGTISASNGVGTAAQQAFSIAVVATLPQWEALYLSAAAVSNPTISGAAAIPQHDGVPNLLKYLFDIDPSKAMTPADCAAMPALGLDTTTNPGTEYLTLTYRENQLASGISVLVQTSTDMKTWTNVTPNFTQNLGTDSTTGDPILEVEVKNVSATPEFLRLNVTMP